MVLRGSAVAATRHAARGTRHAWSAQETHHHPLIPAMDTSSTLQPKHATTCRQGAETLHPDADPDPKCFSSHMVHLPLRRHRRTEPAVNVKLRGDTRQRTTPTTKLRSYLRLFHVDVLELVVQVGQPLRPSMFVLLQQTLVLERQDHRLARLERARSVSHLPCCGSRWRWEIHDRTLMGHSREAPDATHKVQGLGAFELARILGCTRVTYSTRQTCVGVRSVLHATYCELTSPAIDDSWREEDAAECWSTQSGRPDEPQIVTCCRARWCGLPSQRGRNRQCPPIQRKPMSRQHATTAMY